MKTILLIYIYVFLSSCSNSQLKQSSENISRKKANYVIEDVRIKEALKDKPYLLFSINDKWFYLVGKNEDEFYECFAVLNSKNELGYFETNTIECSSPLNIRT